MTPQQIKAMKQALEALEKCRTYHQQDWSSEETTKPEVKQAITAIKEALAQTQEPVATVESVATVVSESGNQEVTMSWWHEPALPVGTKLYTTPPQRTWVGLTDEQRSQLVTLHHGWNEYGQAIEASLKQQNGYAEENT